MLHRDIKPPNILVNDDGRPVLIDFGSARFESGDATSTKVTFHTPPYAAIEQYVKTYAQGPWTDVYALGVVLYECVTGEKPPEVLERMHGGLGQPLAEGNWPGYSETFLKAIDVAMTIRPDERPQSISEWLALFDDSGPASASAPIAERRRPHPVRRDGHLRERDFAGRSGGAWLQGGRQSRYPGAGRPQRGRIQARRARYQCNQGRAAATGGR